MLKNILLLTLPSLLALLVLLEVFLTFVIPASEFPSYYYDQDEHILRFSSSAQRDGVFTIGLLAQQRGRWHINNRGWNSLVDFGATKGNPRIAIIGDSYVEALQVDVENSIGGQLGRLMGPDIDVYAFGISGASLSQYLQMARYARDHFHPDVLVFNVVHNDFDESLCSVRQQAGMLCLDDGAEAIREAPITPYRPNRMTRLARHSSLLRFVVANLQMSSRLSRLFSSAPPSPRYNANIDVDQVKLRQARIEKATDYVLTTLRREHGEIPILFLIDAPRRDIYEGRTGQSDVLWLHHLLRNRSERLGFHVVDLTDEFSRLFQAHRVRFESDYDWHWNERGHLTAARVLQAELKQRRLIGRTSPHGEALHQAKPQETKAGTGPWPGYAGIPPGS